MKHLTQKQEIKIKMHRMRMNKISKKIYPGELINKLKNAFGKQW